MVERLVVVADHAAPYRLAGLTQLERLLIEIERWLAARPVTARAPELVVRWTEAGLLDRQPVMDREHSALRYREIVSAGMGEGEPPNPTDSATVTLRTCEVWRPGGIARHLAALEADRPSAGEADRLGVLAAARDVPRLERLLFQALGKPSDGFVTRWLHRRISTSVTRLLARTRVAPNHVSAGVFGLFAGASIFAAQGTYAAFVAGTILFKLGDIIDGCDGELSRVKYLDSRFGAWLDTTVDMCGNMAFLVALGVGLWRGTWPGGPGRPLHLYEALATLVAQVVVIVGFAQYTRRTSGAAHFAAFGISLAQKEAGGWKQRVILAVAGLLRRDFYTWVFVIVALAGQPQWIVHGAAAIVAVHIPILLYAWWRTLSPAAAA
jgi:hypothetical protein